jgi:hypothetical protein
MGAREFKSQFALQIHVDTRRFNRALNHVYRLLHRLSKQIDLAQIRRGAGDGRLFSITTGGNLIMAKATKKAAKRSTKKAAKKATKRTRKEA